MTIDNADGTAAPETSIKPPSKRNRIQLSCTHCRHAKLKCDRERPCSQCVKRGRSSLCTFPPPVARKRPAVSMHNRLKHLESLVKEAMASQPSDQPIDHPGVELHSPLPVPATQLQNHAEMGVTDNSGRVVLGPNDPTYVGATHWAAMLDDIEEVKGYFSEIGEGISLDEESLPPELSLLSNYAGSPATSEDLLNALPERSIVNRLVSRYFNSNSPALHIIHKPTFQKNYKKFWDDPRSSPISFLALIYSIMCLGTFAALGSGEENADARGTPMEMIRSYRGCCARCLELSNYAKHPGPYTLETFLIYMECELVLSKGDQMGCYLIVGVAVRLALRMGLHRDSDNVEGNITPYQGEIRRRIWHLLVQMDLLVSFHNGLPSMVQAVQSDTRTPLNLQDQDFDEDTTKLPLSRPETEITGMSYALTKGRLARVFGKIVEQANLLTLPNYAEVTALDGELQQAFSAIPPFLRVVPMDLCITDSAELIIRRYSLAVLFQKSRCILHRKYIMKEKESVEFSYSKTAAIDASRELIRFQSEVHKAAQPGGPLCKDLWVISSLALHDLLLAAVIIYLCLIQESVEVAPTVGDQQIPSTRQAEMIAALEGSYRIWCETRSMSVETKKAYDVLGNMLKRLNSVFQLDSVERSIYTDVDDAPGHDTGGAHVKALPEWYVLLTLSSCAALQASRSRTPNIKVISNQSLESVPLPEISTGTLGRFGEGQYGGLDDAIPFSSPTIQSNLALGPIPMDIIADTTMDFDWVDVFDNHIRQTHVNDQSWPDVSFQNFNSEEQNNSSL